MILETQRHSKDYNYNTLNMVADKKEKEGKRKRYGQPRSPRGEQALLMAKDKKMRQSQACDRCRLKKVKCDGMKPSCSQCAKVNFMCRTSDRLTRRGFPRGYTEMLETEVVRLQKLMESRGISVELQEESDTKQIVTPSTNEEVYAGLRTMEKDEKETDVSRCDGSTVAALAAHAATGSASDAGTETAVVNGGGVGGKLEFPFVNDTFHYYNNYRREDNYMGNATWNILTASIPTQAESSSGIRCETDCFVNYQLSAMKNILHLDSNAFFLPKFLLVKYDYNLPKLVKLLRVAVEDFGKIENSLIPLLYPFDRWEKELVRHLPKPNESSSSAASPSRSLSIDPITLLTLFYIIQLNWSCFNDFKLFQLTKMVCVSSRTRLETLQCMLLASFYFMGGQTSAVIHHTSDNSQVWATELLHIAYSMVLNLGLYVNFKRMIPLGSNQKFSPQHHRGVTFWVFQYLDSWWSFLQGLPKSNFLADEFNPQSISSLSVPALTPFTLLLGFTQESLDGCNLLHVLASGSTSGRSKIVYVTESFRKMLVKWKLYHKVQDHEEDFDPDGIAHLSTNLTKPDMVEIQLTLVYLIVSFLSNERFNDLGRETADTMEMSSGSSAENIALHSSNLEEIAYEILSLYSLVLMDHARSEQPQLLKILHLLPCDNRHVIHMCLSTLNNWAMCSRSGGEMEGRSSWNYDRYRDMVSQWCKFYLADKVDDSLWQQLIISFKLDFNAVQPQNFYNWNEVEYLQNVDVFNGNPQVFSKNQLLRSNPHAIMDQFDIFSPINIGGGGDTNRPIFSNIQSSTLSQQVPEEPQQQFKNPRGNISEHDNANIIDTFKHRPRFPLANEETDDGYAEDDDDDDDDTLSKPLEIPFSRRAGSLFYRGTSNHKCNDNKNNNNNDNNNNNNNNNNNKKNNNDNENKKGNEKKRKQRISTTTNHQVDRLRRHTLDHIILDSSESEGVRLQAPSYTRNEEQVLLNDAATGNDGNVSFHNYALNAANSKHNRSRSIGEPLHADPLVPNNPTAQPSATEHGAVMFDRSVGGQLHDRQTSTHGQFVGTPRALVDLLILPPEGQQGANMMNPPSSCNSLAAGNSDTNT